MDRKALIQTCLLHSTMPRKTRQSCRISHDTDRHPPDIANHCPPTPSNGVQVAITSSPSRRAIFITSSPSHHTGHQDSALHVVFPPPVQAHPTTARTTSAEVPPELYSTCPDPVKWWATHQSTFPRLAQMARDILSIPGE